MKNMFRGTKLVNLDLSFFDTSNVADMSYMFEGMSELLNISWGKILSLIWLPRWRECSQMFQS